MRPHTLLLALTLAAAPAVAQSPSKSQPPATLRSILLEQLRTTHNKADWFVPVNAAIAGLTPEQASFIPASANSQSPGRPGSWDHSVGMLAYHLLFWNQQELEKFTGAKHTPFTGANTETFNKWDASTWNSTVTQLDEVLTALEHVVETADDRKLQSIASEIAHISAHNAYHTGQILEIRKLAGTWNPDHGVK